MKSFGVLVGLSLFLVSCSEKAPEESLENMTITMGNEQSSIGSNISRPDWLPDNLALPEGLNIQMAGYDADAGEGFIHGTIPNIEMEIVSSAQRAMLEAAGYTVEDTQTDGGFWGTHENGREVTIDSADSAENTVNYRLLYLASHSVQAINNQAAAKAAAKAYDGNGKLVLEVGNETFTLQGSCHVTDLAVQFTSADGTSTLIASAHPIMPSVSGNLVVQNGGTMKMFNTLSSAPAGEEPDVEVSATGFTYTGDLVDLMDSTRSAGIMTMDCTRH